VGERKKRTKGLIFSLSPDLVFFLLLFASVSFGKIRKKGEFPFSSKREN
jgi:hypothetical protein